MWLDQKLVNTFIYTVNHQLGFEQEEKQIICVAQT